jgi:hypothetical protein
MNGEHAGERQRINARKEKDGVRETFLQADLTPAKLDSLEQTRKSLERVPTRWLFPCFAVREVMSSRPSAASRPYPISCHRVAAAPTRTFRSAADLLSAAPLFGKDFGRIHYNPIATVFGGSSPIPFANFSHDRARVQSMFETHGFIATRRTIHMLMRRAGLLHDLDDFVSDRLR